MRSLVTLRTTCFCILMHQSPRHVMLARQVAVQLLPIRPPSDCVRTRTPKNIRCFHNEYKPRMRHEPYPLYPQLKFFHDSLQPMHCHLHSMTPCIKQKHSMHATTAPREILPNLVNMILGICLQNALSARTWSMWRLAFYCQCKLHHSPRLPRRKL